MAANPETEARLKRRLRIVNAIFWCGVWIGVVVWSETFGRWVLMGLQAFVPVMLWGGIHIALRPGGSEA